MSKRNHYRCPKCNSLNLLVEATVVIHLPSGEVRSESETGDFSHTICADCEAEGNLREFLTVWSDKNDCWRYPNWSR